MKLLRIVTLLALTSPASLFAASNTLEGTWLITIAFDGTPPAGFPASFPVMHSFAPSGEVIEANSLPPSHGAGLGEWAAVAPWQFRYTLRFFVTDQTGAVIGYAQVRQWIQTDHEYSTLLACRFIGDIFAFNGTQLLHSTGSCTGSRIVIDLDQPPAAPVGGSRTN
jgi:hypothetical protein